MAHRMHRRRPALVAGAAVALAVAALWPTRAVPLAAADAAPPEAADRSADAFAAGTVLRLVGQDARERRSG